MKAWALAAAAAVLLLAGVAHAQDGPCLQTVVGCTTCDDADPSKCSQCNDALGFIQAADSETNTCTCQDGLELVGAACQPITPLVDPPTIELVNEPVKPDPYPYNPEYTYPFRPATDKRTYMRAMRARCARRFPGCKQCDEHLKRCVYCGLPLKLRHGKCRRRQHKCRKGHRIVKGRCLRVHKRH